MEGMSQKEKAFIDSIRSEHYFKVFEIMYGTGFAPLVMAALHEFLNDKDFTGVLDVYAGPIDPHETWLKEMEHLVHYSFAIWHGEVLDYLVENKGMDIKNMRSVRNWHNPFLLFNNAVVNRTYSYYRKLAKDNKRAANFTIAFNTEFDEVKIAKDREILCIEYDYNYRIELPAGDGYDISDVKFIELYEYEGEE